MTLKEKIELIQGSTSKEILEGGGHNGTPLLKYVFEIHEGVFGTPCKTCSGLLPGYIAKIQNINLNTLETMSAKERNYRMKSGSVIHVRGTNKYYSDLNLTDEVAEKLLMQNPNRSVLFAKMPKNALENLAKKKEAQERKKTEEAAKAAAEAQAEAERVAKEEEEARKAAEEAEKAAASKKVEDTPAAPEKEVEVKEAEEVKTEEAPKVEEEVPQEREKTDLELNMNELREKYPHIKARSKEEFLRELNA